MEDGGFEDCDGFFVEVEAGLFDCFDEPLLCVALCAFSLPLVVLHNEEFVTLTHLLDLIRELLAHPYGSLHVRFLGVSTIFLSSHFFSKLVVLTLY